MIPFFHKRILIYLAGLVCNESFLTALLSLVLPASNKFPWGAFAFAGLVPCSDRTKLERFLISVGENVFPHACIPLSGTPMVIVLKTLPSDPPCNQYLSVRFGPTAFPSPLAP